MGLTPAKYEFTDFRFFQVIPWVTISALLSNWDVLFM